jgi:hypothetical protein
MSPLVPAVDRRVQLHFKVLHPPPPTMTPAAMADYMRAVYLPHGIDVVVATPVQDLSQLDVYKDLCVEDCTLRTATEDQDKLFAYRDDVPDDEICVYFVRSTIDPFAGCASRADRTGFPAGRPAAVVTEDATAWTLGHECGHVLGLSHAVPTDRVMVSGTWKIAANPPALDGDEVAAIKKSAFTKPMGPGPVPPASAPPPPPPHPDDDAGDAIRKKGDDDGRAANAIRSALDHDDGVDYDALAREFGPSAVEALATVVRESRPRIAAGRGLPVVARAAGNEDPVVRVAAAASTRRLPPGRATRLVERLLEDGDVGVRGHAVRSAVRIGTPDLLARVRVMAQEDPSPALRELAVRLLDPPTKSAS